MIDFSHGNSSKVPAKQIDVGQDVARQLESGDGRIFGIMAESHLKAGRQDLVPGKPLAYGVSITDGCISWEETRAMLDGLAAGVRARRLKASTSD
jgi:3-deoxy-7-phosphoheptulonate synthase